MSAFSPLVDPEAERATGRKGMAMSRNVSPIQMPEEAEVCVFEARDSFEVATRGLPRLLKLDQQRSARQRHDFRTPSGGAHPVDGRKRVGQTKDGLERPHREAGRVGDACVAAGVGEDPGHGPSLRP